MSIPDRLAMLDKDSTQISVRRQCGLLRLTRSLAYRPPIECDPQDLRLMRAIDELFTRHPFLGSRRIAVMLSTPHDPLNRKRIQRLMRMMGIEALGPKPGTSTPSPENKIFPYLLRKLSIERVNQVWAADITYIPLPQGFAYLVAIIDWVSRAILAWRLSNTMDTSFCVDAVGDALAHFGCPEIFNTDQGSQFTAKPFVSNLQKEGIKVSMDGRGRWMDNVFIERVWRSLKYEEVYLSDYANQREARQGISNWIDFYNFHRPHQALKNATPMKIWREGARAQHLPCAMEMTLRLENARAFPTSPQRQHQQDDFMML